MALAVAAASLAFSLTASASLQQLILNQQTAAIMSGPYDLEWFYYTPDQSGIYSFLSYNVPACEAYLFVRESDPDTGEKNMCSLPIQKMTPITLQTVITNCNFALHTIWRRARPTFLRQAGFYQLKPIRK